MTPLLCILRPAPFCPVTPFFVPSHSGKSYSLSFSLARRPKRYPDTHLPPHSSCSPLPLIPPSSFPFQFYEGTLQNGVSDIERQFTGADLKWPNPSRPMYFLISTGNEEMASTGERGRERERERMEYVGEDIERRTDQVQFLRFTHSTSLSSDGSSSLSFYHPSLPPFHPPSLSFNPALSPLPPPYPFYPALSPSPLSLLHPGTSFLNRTEAASVEKIVTTYLKNGITPDQIGVSTEWSIEPSAAAELSLSLPLSRLSLTPASPCFKPPQSPSSTLLQ